MNGPAIREGVAGILRQAIRKHWGLILIVTLLDDILLLALPCLFLAK